MFYWLWSDPSTNKTFDVCGISRCEISRFEFNSATRYLGFVRVFVLWMRGTINICTIREFAFAVQRVVV